MTLVDQFEPGDRRATSGGETRLIRCGHGADADYTASARRARTLWRELEAESGDDLLIECGLAWFAHRERRLGGGVGARRCARRASRSSGSSVEDGGAPVPELPRRGPRRSCCYEPEAGVLRAQRAVQALARAGRGARRARRARPRGAGRRTRCVVERRAARGRRRRVGLRRLADARSSRSHVNLTATRQELFFLDGGAGVGARARLGRLRRRGLRHRRPRRPRRQVRAGLRGAAAGARRRPARRSTPTTRQWTRDYCAPPLPRARDAP